MSPPPARGRALAWALAVALAFLVVGILTLPRYGATWDERENFYSGEAHYHFLATGDKTYLDTTSNKLPPDEAPLYWWGASFPDRYPPVTNTLAAASKHLFTDRLRWLPPVDAYHLPIVALSALLVFAVGAVAISRYGLGPGLFAAIALAAFPRFFADAHNNIKDVPEAAWYGLTLLAFWRGFATQRMRWNLAGGVLLACALGTKPNALFLPIVGVIWLGILPGGRLWRREPLGVTWPWAASLLLAVPAGAAGAVAAWPWLWHDGAWGGLAHRLGQFFHYLRFIGSSQKGWNFEAPPYLAITAPEVVLVFAAIGLLAAWRHDRRNADGFEWLCLVWLAFPLARLCLPGTTFYDGIRHFIEVVTPLCFLAGRGLAAAWPRWLGRRRRPALAMAGILALAIGPAIVYHPHQNTYFNLLVGGYAGAQRLGVPWSHDYWAGSYREATRWLDAHGKPGYRVMTPLAGQTMVLHPMKEGLTFFDYADIDGYLAEQARFGRPVRVYAIVLSKERHAFQETLAPVAARTVAWGRVFEIYEISRGQADQATAAVALMLAGPQETGRTAHLGLALEASTAGPFWRPRAAPLQAGKIRWFSQDGDLSAEQEVSFWLPQFVEPRGTICTLRVATPEAPGRYRVQLEAPVGTPLTHVTVASAVGGDSATSPKGCNAQLRVVSAPTTARPGGQARVVVDARNIGQVRWLSRVAGPGEVRLASRWYAGPLAPPFEVKGVDGRGFLARDVSPGESARIVADIPVPAKPGDYTVELSMVSELVTWFNDNGTVPATLSIAVR
ncbi:MAG: glycosyltransferase family 39 protein [Candidatus Sericytochromatia bacterium]|nr:glycosyltransferase family 39 protein [Candidatus Tanganyikabacteria bacterium]